MNLRINGGTKEGLEEMEKIMQLHFNNKKNKIQNINY